MWYSFEEIYIIRLKNIHKFALDESLLAFCVGVSVLLVKSGLTPLLLHILLHFVVILEEYVEKGTKENIKYHPWIHIIEQGQIYINWDSHQSPQRSASAHLLRLEGCFYKVEEEDNVGGDDEEFKQII